MSLQDDFIDPIKPCLNPNFTFPGIDKPGMPNFALGCFLATFAGINYVLQFIPPTIDILPDIVPPTIDLFLNAFLSGIILPSSYPGFSFGPLTIPAVGDPPYAYNLSGELKLMAACIILPFELILNIVDGLLNLEIRIPTFDEIYNLFIQLTIDIGINTPSVLRFGHCLAESMAALFSSLL